MSGYSTKELASEFLGSFIFYAIVISQKNDQFSPLVCGIALFIGILIAKIGSENAGHLNPGVTFFSYLNGNFTESHAVYFIVVQLIAAVTAWQWNYYINKDSIVIKNL